MVVPLGPPWVKEPGEFARDRIEAGEAWPRVSAAVQAGKGAHAADGRADYPVVRNGALVRADRETPAEPRAILPRAARPGDDTLPGCLVHEASGLSFLEGPPCFGVKEGQYVCNPDVAFQFLPLRRREFAFTVSLGKVVHPGFLGVSEIE